MKLPTKKEIVETLKGVDERRSILETAVQAVCQGFTPALFLWGSPGMGKSHLLHTILDGLMAKQWKHHTAYATPKALMLALAESPAAIHVFEDCEKMLKTDLSASLLRAACGSPEGRDRWVTYETAHETLRVRVTGGIIIVTNANLSRTNGPMQGVASRFRPLEWKLTQEEIVAIILKISDQGWSKGTWSLTPKECHQVATELIGMVTGSNAGLPLDVRLYTEHALPTFLFCKTTGQGKWQDVLLSKLHGMARTDTESQAERTDKLRRIAQMIGSSGGSTKQKLEKWTNMTGLGKSLYYRYANVKQAKTCKGLTRKQQEQVDEAIRKETEAK